jgi:hypothetical protein
MKTPQRCVTDAEFLGPDRDLGHAIATIYLVIMLGVRMVLAMAFLSPGSAGTSRAPSGSRGTRHSWRSPRSARSARRVRRASLAGVSDSPGVTNVTKITNPDSHVICVIVPGVLEGEGISNAADPVVASAGRQRGGLRIGEGRSQPYHYRTSV